MNLQKQLRNHNLAWKISSHVVRKTPSKGVPYAGKAISIPYWNIRIKFQSKSQKTLIILNKITSPWELFQVVYNQTTKAHRNSTCKHTFSWKPNGLNVKNTAAHPPQTISHTYEKMQGKDTKRRIKNMKESSKSTGQDSSEHRREKQAYLGRDELFCDDVSLF